MTPELGGPSVQVPVVVGQIPIVWDPERNRERITSFLADKAQRGDLVVLPEAALSGYDDELSGLDDLDPDALEDAIDAVAEYVSQVGVHLLCGSLQFVDGTWRNVAVYLAPDGQRWTYQKVNLANHERGRFTAGSNLSLLPINQGAATTHVGVQLCREIRYPEQWHVLARSGADLLAYLTYAANPKVPAEVWRSHLISRAAETQRFVLAANVADSRQHCPSMIISPNGEVLDEAPIAETTALRLTLDLTQTADQHLRQQRSDVVAMHYLGDPEPAAGENKSRTVTNGTEDSASQDQPLPTT